MLNFFLSREQVCKQFHPIIPESSANSTGPQQSQQPGGRPATTANGNPGNANLVSVSIGSNVSAATQTTHLSTTQTQTNGLNNEQNIVFPYREVLNVALGCFSYDLKTSHYNQYSHYLRSKIRQLSGYFTCKPCLFCYCAFVCDVSF